MTKKSSKMNPTSQVQENFVVEEEKLSSAPKRPGSEIDKIFSRKKRKKSEQEKAAKPDEDVHKRPYKTKNKKNKKKKIKGSNDGEFVDPPSQPRKRTKDGLAIYTEDELGFNKADAKGTPFCPSDCSYCFQL